MAGTRMKTQTEVRAVDYSRKWQVAAAVASCIFLLTFSGINLALPILVEVMETSFAVVQWVLLAYSLTAGALLLGAGRLGDLLGRKRVLSVGLGIFILGALFSGLAPSIGWLIAARVFEAVGAALIGALLFALLTAAFPEDEKGKALGISSTVASLAFVLGPLVGGLLISVFSWRAVFLSGVPLGLLSALLVYRFLPPSRPTAIGRFDYAGAVALFVGMLTLLAALNLGQQDGFRIPVVRWLFLGSVVVLPLFLWIERRSPEPILPLGLFRSRELNVYSVAGLLACMALYGSPFLLVFYLTNVLGLEGSLVGALLATLPIMLGVTSPISGTMADRFGFRLISAAGLLILAIAFWLLGYLNETTTPLGFVLLLLPLGLGAGLFVSPNNRAIMGAVSKDQLGLASGLLSLIRNIGGVTGIVVMGALWSSRVAHHVGGLGEDVTRASHGAQAAGLRDTFLALSVLMLTALALVLWEWTRETREQRALALAARSGLEESSP